MSEYGSVNFEKLRRSQLFEKPKPEPKEEEKIGVFRGEDLEPEQPVVPEPPEQETPKDTPEIERLKETVAKQLEDFEKKLSKGEEEPREVKEKVEAQEEKKKTEPEVKTDEEKPVDKLAEARRGYVRAKKETKGKRKEYGAAKKEYEQLRFEHIQGDIDKFLEEKARLLEAELNAVVEKPGHRPLTVELYHKLGEINLNKFFNAKTRTGKTILGMANARTAISLSLLGVGLAAGAGTLLGLGAISLRRGLAAGTTTLGTYGYLTARREKKFTKNLSANLDKLNTSEIENAMASIESKSILAGLTLSDLQQDDLYSKLVSKYREQLKVSKENVDTKDISRLLDGYNQTSERLLREKLKSEKRVRFGLKAVAVAAGGVVGSGIVGKLTGKAFNVAKEFSGFGGQAPVEHVPAPQHMETVVKIAEQPVASAPVETPAPTAGPAPVSEFTPPQAEVQAGSPSASSGTNVVETTPSPPPSPQPTPEATAGTAAGGEEVKVEGPSTPPVELRAGAAYEVRPDGEVILHAGQRGIEGAILDYAKAVNTEHPDQFRNLIKNLAKYSPDGSLIIEDPKELGPVVHRFVLAYAKEHNFDPTKLDRILAADVRLKDIIELDEPSVKYFEKAAAAVSENVSESTPVPVADISADVSEAVEAAVSDLTPTPVSETTAAELAELANQKATRTSEVVRKVTGTAETGGGAADILKQAQAAAAQARADLERIQGLEPQEPILHSPDANPVELSAGNAVEIPVSELETYINDQFGLHPDEFQAVEGKSIREFTHMFETGTSRFKALYGFLAEKLREIVEENQESNVIDPEVLNKVFLKEIVQDLAIKK